jgi:hypothetical protein
LIWIEENSYYNSKKFIDYIKDITETENIIKTAGGMKGAKVFQEIRISVTNLLYRRICGVTMHNP